jgi:hypothetical protein
MRVKNFKEFLNENQNVDIITDWIKEFMVISFPKGESPGFFIQDGEIHISKGVTKVAILDTVNTKMPARIICDHPTEVDVNSSTLEEIDISGWKKLDVHCLNLKKISGSAIESFAKDGIWNYPFLIVRNCGSFVMNIEKLNECTLHSIDGIPDFSNVKEIEVLNAYECNDLTTIIMPQKTRILEIEDCRSFDITDINLDDVTDKITIKSPSYEDHVIKPKNDTLSFIKATDKVELIRTGVTKMEGGDAKILVINNEPHITDIGNWKNIKTLKFVNAHEKDWKDSFLGDKLYKISNALGEKPESILLNDNAILFNSRDPLMIEFLRSGDKLDDFLHKHRGKISGNKFKF